MVKFENIKVSKISESIVNQIEDFIVSGALKKGERLPPERELAEQLNVSRPSIREAISILEAKGLVSSKRGGGTYVTSAFTDGLTGPLASVLEQHPEKAFDILELRHALEEMAAFYAAKRATRTDKEIIQRCLDNLLACYQDKDTDADLEARADLQFHLAIVDASHNFALIQVMRGLIDALKIALSHNIARIRETPSDHEMIKKQHVDLCHAILAGEAEHAKQCANEHLALVGKNLTELVREEEREKQAKRRLGEG